MAKCCSHDMRLKLYSFSLENFAGINLMEVVQSLTVLKGQATSRDKGTVTNLT